MNDQIIAIASAVVASRADVRTEIRRAAGVAGRGAIRVVVVPGSAAPHVTGRTYEYRTSGGTLIRHPSAYAKRGFSNMVYHDSTRAVVVGADWVVRAGI